MCYVDVHGDDEDEDEDANKNEEETTIVGPVVSPGMYITPPFQS